jgi:hypothetical protein
MPLVTSKRAIGIIKAVLTLLESFPAIYFEWMFSDA